MRCVHNTQFEIDGDHGTGVGYMQFVELPDGSETHVAEAFVA